MRSQCPLWSSVITIIMDIGIRNIKKIHSLKIKKKRFGEHEFNMKFEDYSDFGLMKCGIWKKAGDLDFVC